MFLRKVLFSSTIQAEVECCVVDRICSHDVCYVAGYTLSFACFEKVTAYPVTKCVRVGKTLRSSKFRHGKTYTLELDDEKLACVVLGAIFDAYL